MPLPSSIVYHKKHINVMFMLKIEFSLQILFTVTLYEQLTFDLDNKQTTGMNPVNVFLVFYTKKPQNYQLV